MSVSEDKVLEAASRWVATLKRGPLSRRDQRALKAWLEQDVRHAAALDTMMDVWEGVEPLKDSPVSAALARRLRRRQLKADWSWAPSGFLALAAAAAVVFFATVPLQSRTYVTAVGQARAITLPDHSVVWLNTDTALKVAYTGLRRSLKLERGEAEFKVAHQAWRPFLVSTPNATVRATGTDFSVRYDPAGASRVVLVQGAVRVSGPNEAEPVPMQAGYSLLAPVSGPFQLAKADPQVELAWRQGRLVFDQRPIGEVVQEFARYGGVRVRFADAAVQRVKISGVFRTTDFKSFLRDIAVIDHIRSRTDNNGEVVVESGA
jgi:transmembrane sensor